MARGSVYAIAAVALSASACGQASTAPAARGPASPFAGGTTSEPRPALEPLATAAFQDGIRHYQNATDRSDYARLDPARTAEIAENILLHQRANGGWPPNWDPLRVLASEERQALLAQKNEQDTSFDNRATYPQIEYLAGALQRTGDSRFRDACLRGLVYVLGTQYENGGFPHSWPSTRNYRPRITVMDEVMPGVLSFLRRVLNDGARYAFLPSELRARAAAALARGDRCLLGLQVVVRGQRTIWAGQYDERTLVPTTGRSYELPSLVSDESVAVVEYLMSIAPPNQEIAQAVEAAVAWFESAKIRGIRLEKFAAEPVRYEYHTSTDDTRVLEDPGAPALWARFYEIETNRPFLANRDGKKVYTLAEVERERRTGYRWYGEFAMRLLERDYPAWRSRHAR